MPFAHHVLYIHITYIRPIRPRHATLGNYQRLIPLDSQSITEPISKTTSRLIRSSQRSDLTSRWCGCQITFQSDTMCMRRPDASKQRQSCASAEDPPCMFLGLGSLQVGDCCENGQDRAEPMFLISMARVCARIYWRYASNRLNHLKGSYTVQHSLNIFTREREREHKFPSNWPRRSSCSGSE